MASCQNMYPHIRTKLLYAGSTRFTFKSPCGKIWENFASRQNLETNATNGYTNNMWWNTWFGGRHLRSAGTALSHWSVPRRLSADWTARELPERRRRVATGTGQLSKNCNGRAWQSFCIFSFLTFCNKTRCKQSWCDRWVLISILTHPLSEDGTDLGTKQADFPRRG